MPAKPKKTKTVPMNPLTEKMKNLMDYFEKIPDLDARGLGLLLQLQADLMEDPDIPDDFLLVMPQEMRRAMVLGFIVLTMQNA